MWKPVFKGDVIEVIESPYHVNYPVGTRFVVLDLLDDESALIMDMQGNMDTLCYPEDYKVVGKIDNMIKEYWDKEFKNYNEN
ncbi:hypothetical protein [Metabacillus sp. Hm71]|uniref:hypothetical protein n=1 Tax=Metabacillus sp. Hm71 TaxID=3450743 RepID=UPI003F428BB7